MYMKRIVFLSLTIVFAIALVAQNPLSSPTRVQELDNQIDGLWIRRNTETMQATVIASKTKNKLNQTEPYKMDTIFIPEYVLVETTGMGSDPTTDTFAITSIGASALVKSTARCVLFAEHSQVSSIQTLALSNMANMSGKLVLPASLSHLAVSSILLPGITEIEFLGSIPPTCEVNTYNPWTSSSFTTSADIKITIPEGSLSAYKYATGIGDYFTCLKNAPDPATSVESTSSKQHTTNKVLRNGRIYILRDGKWYDLYGTIFRWVL